MVASYARTAHIQWKAKGGRITLTDTGEYLATVADEQRRRGEWQALAYGTGCMVHTSFPGIFVFQRLVAQFCCVCVSLVAGGSLSGKQDRAILKGDIIREIGAGHHTHSHGEIYLNLVTDFPLATKLDVGSLSHSRLDRLWLPIDGDAIVVCGPPRMADGQ